MLLQVLKLLTALLLLSPPMPQLMVSRAWGRSLPRWIWIKKKKIQIKNKNPFSVSWEAYSSSELGYFLSCGWAWAKAVDINVSVYCNYESLRKNMFWKVKMYRSKKHSGIMHKDSTHTHTYIFLVWTLLWFCFWFTHPGPPKTEAQLKKEAKKKEKLEKFQQKKEMEAKKKTKPPTEVWILTSINGTYLGQLWKT